MERKNKKLNGVRKIGRKKTLLKGDLKFVKDALERGIEMIGGKVDDEALHIPRGLPKNFSNFVNKFIVVCSSYECLLESILEKWDEK